jgi:hypothetical protein
MLGLHGDHAVGQFVQRLATVTLEGRAVHDGKPLRPKLGEFV